MIHQFDVKITLPEDVAELRRRGPCVVVLAESKKGLDLTRGAARGGDQPFTVFVQEFSVGSGFVEESFQGASRAELEQIVHGLLVGGPHRHVGVGALRCDVVAGAVTELHAFAFGAMGAGSEVGLQTDDGFDVVVLGRLIELIGPVEVPVIRDRQCRHAHTFRALEQIVDARGAIEHRELRVAVQVYERIPHDRSFHPTRTGTNPTPGSGSGLHGPLGNRVS